MLCNHVLIKHILPLLLLATILSVLLVLPVLFRGGTGGMGGMVFLREQGSQSGLVALDKQEHLLNTDIVTTYLLAGMSDAVKCNRAGTVCGFPSHLCAVACPVTSPLFRTVFDLARCQPVVNAGIQDAFYPCVYCVLCEVSPDSISGAKPSGYFRSAEETRPDPLPTRGWNLPESRRNSHTRPYVDDQGVGYGFIRENTK